MLDLPKEYTLHFKIGLFVNSVECKDRDGNTVKIPALKRKIETYLTGEKDIPGTGEVIFQFLCNEAKTINVRDFDTEIKKIVATEKFKNHLSRAISDAIEGSSGMGC